jgi:hypothetical protein
MLGGRVLRWAEQVLDELHVWGEALQLPVTACPKRTRQLPYGPDCSRRAMLISACKCGFMDA